MFPKWSIIGFLLLFSVFTLLVANEPVTSKAENRCLSASHFRDKPTLVEKKKYCTLWVDFRKCDYVFFSIGDNSEWLEEKESLLIEDGTYFEYDDGLCRFYSTISLKFDGSLEQTKAFLSKCATKMTELASKDCMATVLKNIENRFYRSGQVLDPVRVKALFLNESATSSTRADEISTTTESGAIGTGMLSAVFFTLFSLL